MQIMTKGILFIGDAETGKSRTARQIQKLYGDDAVYLNGRRFKTDNPFFFANCRPNTKIVIIDEIIHAKDLQFFTQFVPGKLMVNALNQNPFEIELEKLIIICASEIKKSDLPTGASFTKRFEVIEFPHPEISLLFM